MQDKRIHSQHIFLFPFTIKPKAIEESNCPKEKLRTIHDSLEDSPWKYKPFSIGNFYSLGQDAKMDATEENTEEPKDNIWAYNEFNYFYANVRDTLFNQTPEDELFQDTAPVSIFYERQTTAKDEMIICIKGRPEPFVLNIDHLSLRFFETGIGILTITLYNYCHKDFSDILLINDFGRRIYPQFLGAPPDDPKLMETCDPIDITKDSFLAEKIFFTVSGEKIEEEFKTEDFFTTNHKFAAYLEYLLKPFGSKEITPIIDDRMFTICWHENDRMMNTLNGNNSGVYTYENSGEWYQFMFVDGKGLLAQHSKFKKDLIHSSTYPRFTDWGTLYGVTRYSLVCLCSIDKKNDLPYKIIRNHMQKMYYQTCILLLAQRASILLFNNELERIILKFAGEPETNHEPQSNEKQNALENLYIRFLNFQNRMAFDEVTPQEQGIELYNLALKNMNIPDMLASLKQKLEQVHAYLDLKAEREEQTNDRKISDSVARLTLLGAFYLPATFIVAIWSMKIYFLEDVFTKKSSYIFDTTFDTTVLQVLRDHFEWVNLGELVVSAILFFRLTQNMIRNFPEGSSRQPGKSLMSILGVSLKDWLVWPLIILLLAQIALFW